jgi:hypothetical protein
MAPEETNFASRLLADVSLDKLARGLSRGAHVAASSGDG